MNPTIQNSNDKHQFFFSIIVFIVVGLLAFLVFLPFFNVLALSIILAILLNPVFRRFKKAVKRDGIAAMLNQTLFKEVTFPLGTLIGEIESGQIALPDLQRPFVWPNKKVRDRDDEIEENCEEFTRSIHRFSEHAPKFEPDEEKMAVHTKALVDGGIEFVTRVRKQEAAVHAWFVEAFTRDGGVAD